MRDLVFPEEAVNVLDPMESARSGFRRTLPKRFYTEVSVGEAEDGLRILLDGRAVKTPARAALAVPSRALAEAIAAEWAAQGELINPGTMPITRLVNSSLDGVVRDPGAVADEIVRYAGSDMLCYRSDSPAALVARQAAHWDGVLDWAHDAFGARFILSEGVIFATQPDTSLAAVRAFLPTDPLRLGALVSITALTGSALLALAVWQGHLDADAAWAAAHVDEDWNREQWGEDDAATARREARRIEMNAAARVLALLES